VTASPRAPRLGLLLPLGPTPAATAIADRAREAEAAGFDSAWVIEDYYSWECFASLGYLAAVTERIALGVSVTTPYIRPAALLASAAATLDRFANGRFLLGIGRCTGPLLGQIGIRDRLPLTMLAETTEALRLLWRGGTVSYHGKTVEIDRVVPDVLPINDRVPILFGAIGPNALRLAGRVADGVILTSFAPVSYVRWATEQVRTGAMEAGRDRSAVEIVAMVATRVTATPAAVVDELKPWLGLACGMTGRGELLLRDAGTDLRVLDSIRAVLRVDEIVAEGLEPYLHAYKRVRPEAVAAVVPSELVDQAAIVGNVARCRTRLAEFVAAGVDHVIVDSPQPAAELMQALRG
jgi:5,10-methylenetetrahydromethanopterin reductase